MILDNNFYATIDKLQVITLTNYTALKTSQASLQTINGKTQENKLQISVFFCICCQQIPIILFIMLILVQMKILDTNQTHILVSSDKETMILELPRLRLCGSIIKDDFCLGSMQYKTGIAALTKGNIVSVFDFRYNKHLRQIDTYLKLVKVALIKNLMIAVSEQRILIYDFMQNSILYLISIFNGNYVSINTDYYALKILYPINSSLLVQQQIFTTKKININLMNMQSSPVYDCKGQVYAVTDRNIVTFYQQDEIIRGCSFNSDVEIVLAGHEKRKFYIKTCSGGKNNEPIYVEVTDDTKCYLKLTEDPQKRIPVKIEGLQKGYPIVYKGMLYIWKGNWLYGTQQDLEPQFYIQQQKKIVPEKHDNN